VAFAALVTAAAPLVALLGGTAGITAAITAAGAALAAFAVPIAIAVAAIGTVYLAFKYWDQITGFIAGVYNAIQTYLVDKFYALLGRIQGAVDSVTGFFKNMYDKVVGHSYVPDMIDGIGQQFGRMNEVMTKPAQEAAAATEAALKAASDAWLASPFNRMAKNAMTILTDSGGVAKNAYGQPVAGQGEINALPRSLGHQNIQVAVYGSVLSTKQELATLVGDAMMQSYSQGGNRTPV